MSVSSHLTPEPERRLWVLLESMRGEVERANKRAFALAALSLAELIYLKTSAPAGAIVGLAVLLLALALPLAVFALSPLEGRVGLAALLDSKDKPSGADRLFVAEDVAKYLHGDLINKLDRYFGGGITATQYYEDLVGEALVGARAATRKSRLLRALLALVFLGQLALLAAFLSPRP